MAFDFKPNNFLLSLSKREKHRLLINIQKCMHIHTRQLKGQELFVLSNEASSILPELLQDPFAWA
jgi:hypothetical protein